MLQEFPFEILRTVQNDPYAPPAPSAHSSAVFTDNGLVTQGVLNQLAGTKPWVRFMSVLTFIIAGFMLLGALAILIAGSALATQGNAGIFAGGMGVVLAVVYAAFSFIYIYPAMKLWKYANRIGSLLVSGSTADLEDALSQQRSFWKFLGVFVLTVIGLYLLVIIGAVAFGGFAAMSGKS